MPETDKTERIIELPLNQILMYQLIPKHYVLLCVFLYDGNRFIIPPICILKHCIRAMGTTVACVGQQIVKHFRIPMACNQSTGECKL